MARKVTPLSFDAYSLNRPDRSIAFAKLVLQEHHGSSDNPLFNKDALSQAHALELG